MREAVSRLDFQRRVVLETVVSKDVVDWETLNKILGNLETQKDLDSFISRVSDFVSDKRKLSRKPPSVASLYLIQGSRVFSS